MPSTLFLGLIFAAKGQSVRYAPHIWISFAGLTPDRPDIAKDEIALLALPRLELWRQQDAAVGNCIKGVQSALHKALPHLAKALAPTGQSSLGN